MAKPLVGTGSSKTKLDLIKIDLQLKANPYQLTDEETSVVGTVMKRFDRMRSARTVMDRFWQLAMLQYEAMFIPYADGRARSNVPLEWAIIELFVAEAIQRDSDLTISAIGESDIGKAEVMKRIADYVKKQSGIKQQLYKNEYLTAIIGTGFYLTGYNENSRVIRDVTYDSEGLQTFEKKLLKKNRVIIKALDPRNVYLDDRTTDFEDDTDQIFIDYITPEQLQSFKYDENYKNIDKVCTNLKNDQAFFTAEERGKQNDGVIELMNYFNKDADAWEVLANRSVPIRSTPLPYSHKELPIVPRQYGYHPLQKYGRGLCEALLNFKSTINQLQEMIMDGIRRSNNSMFVISNGLTFDGDSFGFNNTLVKANGPVGPESFQEIRGQQPNNAIFSYSQDLLKQVAIYIGIDPAGIIGQASSTAFETAVKQESSLKRVNVILTNRDMALEKVYTRHISNIMQFFPIKTAQGICDIDGSKQPKEAFPTILLDNEKYIKGEFVEMSGKFPFEVQPDLIRGQYDIEVKTNFNAPTLKSMKIERYKEFTQVLLQMSQIQQVPGMADKIPMDKLIDEIIYDFDIDIDAIGGMEGSIKAQKAEILAKVQQMSGIGANQGQPSIPEEATNILNKGTGKSLGSGELRKEVGGVMTPKTPVIGNTSSAVSAMV